MIPPEHSREGINGVRLSGLQLFVAVVVLGFILLPFIAEVVWGQGILLGFLTNNRAYMAYVLIGGIAVTVALDWFVRHSSRMRELGNVPLSAGTGLLLRVISLALMMLLDVGLWILFFLVVDVNAVSVTAALLFHAIWIGSAIVLKARGNTLVLGIQLPFLPLVVVFLLAFAIFAGLQ